MSLTNYEVIAIVLAIIGSVSSVIYVTQLGYNHFVKKRFTWRDVMRAVNTIISSLNARSFSPDVVVCLGRGGAIMGGLIAGNFGAVRVCSMDRRRITSHKQSMSVPDFFVKPNIPGIASLATPGSKLKVLLVTGEVVTGYDLYYAKSVLTNELSTENVDYELVTSSFMCLQHANLFPDICYFEGKRYYKAPPWRVSKTYINDRREDKLFHVEKQK